MRGRGMVVERVGAFVRLGWRCEAGQDWGKLMTPVEAGELAARLVVAAGTQALPSSSSRRRSAKPTERGSK